MLGTGSFDVFLMVQSCLWPFRPPCVFSFQANPPTLPAKLFDARRPSFHMEILLYGAHARERQGFSPVRPLDLIMRLRRAQIVAASLDALDVVWSKSPSRGPGGQERFPESRPTILNAVQSILLNTHSCYYGP